MEFWDPRQKHSGKDSFIKKTFPIGGLGTSSFSNCSEAGASELDFILLFMGSPIKAFGDDS